MNAMKSCVFGVVTLVAAAGCVADAGQESATEAAPDETAETTSAATTSAIKHVFVVALENHDASQIIGNTSNAPYLNSLLVTGASATSFSDELPLGVPSEPHYIWMEAGTNAFSDRTFTSDSDPSKTNSTASTAHLVTQIRAATNGVSWMAYQEGLNSKTGACPVASSGYYKTKHNPFVFFRDVAGSPPSKTNSYCAAHHRPYTSLAGDLAAGSVASYVFITPDQCHDMHGQLGCPSSKVIKAGDDWLRAELPKLIAFANANAGVVFVTFDEGESTSKMPFLAIGAGVKANYESTVSYTHSSMLKSVERILGLPTLPSVASANDLSDLFVAGAYP